MRKIWPVLLVVWPYAGLAVLYWTLTSEPLNGTPLLCWLAALLVICVGNVVCALLRGQDAARVGMVLKAALVPFYVCVFFIGMMTVVAPPALIILFLLDGLLLTTSAWTLRGIHLRRKAGEMSGCEAAALTFSQLVFVLDVPGSILLVRI